MRMHGRYTFRHFRKPVHSLIAILILTIGGFAASSQIVSAQSLPPISDEAEFSLITMYPGTAIYSIYGHSALRVYRSGLQYRFII